MFVRSNKLLHRWKIVQALAWQRTFLQNLILGVFLKPASIFRSHRFITILTVYIRDLRDVWWRFDIKSIATRIAAHVHIYVVAVNIKNDHDNTCWKSRWQICRFSLKNSKIMLWSGRCSVRLNIETMLGVCSCFYA